MKKILVTLFLLVVACGKQVDLSGVKGVVGDTGAAGETGATGIQGPSGKDGTDGKDGSAAPASTDPIIVTLKWNWEFPLQLGDKVCAKTIHVDPANKYQLQVDYSWCSLAEVDGILIYDCTGCDLAHDGTCRIPYADLDCLWTPPYKTI